MKKFIIFLLIILLFAVSLVGFDEFIKSVTLAITIALVLRGIDEVVDD